MSHANGGQASDQANLVGQAGAGNQSGQVVSKARHGRPDLPRATLRSPAPSLVVLHPGAPQQHSQIYQSLYVQGRGALRRDLASRLRTGRALRKPRRRTAERRGRIPDMVNISARPPEVEDRAVPGNWEGDLIVGKASGSAIGTLVERMTGFVMLLYLPDNHGADAVQEAMVNAMSQLPAVLKKTLT
jgi:IS30 family transposase